MYNDIKLSNDKSVDINYLMYISEYKLYWKYYIFF